MRQAAASQARAPDIGSLWPMLMWGTCALFFCYGFFVRVAPSVMVADLMRDFGAGAAVVGNMSAFYFYAYAGLQLPVGIGLDRFGPRRMITAAAAVCGIGSLLFGVAEGLGVAYAGRFLIGAGAAFAFIGTLKLVAIWFPANKFALIFGLTAAIGAGGAVVGQAPLAALIAVTGWRAVQIGGGLAAFVIAALIWALVRDRPRGPAPDAAVARPPILRGLAIVTRNPQTWLAATVNAAVSAPLLSFGALWGVPYMMTAYGLSRPAAAFASSIMLIGHAVGAPILGAWSDRVGRRKPFMIGCIVMATVTFAALIYLPGQPVLAAYALLFVCGLASGAATVDYATAKEHNPIAYTGTSTGFVNMTTMGASAFLQFLLGWLLDLQWDGASDAGARLYSMAAYQIALSPLVILGAAGIIIVLFVRESYGRGGDPHG